MVTFAQAQERAEQWVNSDVPSYQHREVRVREFDLGFVCRAVDRQDRPTSDGGQVRLVISRNNGEATLWPGLPVDEVVRRFEEEYGAATAAVQAPPAPARRDDFEAASFLLIPPQLVGLPGRSASSGAAAAAGIPGDGRRRNRWRTRRSRTIRASLIGLPLIAAISLGVMDLLPDSPKPADSTKALTQLTRSATALADALQRERDVSAGPITRGEPNDDAVVSSRQDYDRAWKAFSVASDKLPKGGNNSSSSA